MKQFRFHMFFFWIGNIIKYIFILFKTIGFTPRGDGGVPPNINPKGRGEKVSPTLTKISVNILCTLLNLNYYLAVS